MRAAAIKEQMTSLRARIAAAYDAACDTDAAAEGGGFVADSFLLSVDALPRVLNSLGVTGELQEEVQQLLEANAEPQRRGTKVIEKEPFIQALEAALGGVDEDEESMPVEDTGRRRSRRRAAPTSFSRAAASDSGSEVSEEMYDPERDASFAESDDDAEIAEPNRTPKARPAASRGAGARMGDASMAHARVLYGLLLERVPLAPPVALRRLPGKTHDVRKDVDAEEVQTRQVGIDELRYAAQSLGEKFSDTELQEMLQVAAEMGGGPSSGRSGSSAPRIGLEQWVQASWAAPLTADLHEWHRKVISYQNREWQLLYI